MSEYRYTELVTGGANNRNHIVQMPTDGPWDYYGRPAPRDAYCSAYHHGPELAAYVQRTGSVRGYPGACCSPWLWFDFDDTLTNGEAAHRELKAFVEATCTRQGVMAHIDDFRFWFSGNKGFHCFLYGSGIESVPASTQFPDDMKKFCINMAGKYSTLDRSVYDSTRIFRIPNSKHGKSGLHKIPLLAAELWALSLADIRTLAKKQRNIEDARKSIISEMKEHGSYGLPRITER
jgi:hypothetical protein